MATPRQIEANRRNAQKSTGPRTEAGRARSRLNALKHGLSRTLPAPTPTKPLVLPLAQAIAGAGVTYPSALAWAEQIALESLTLGAIRRQRAALLSQEGPDRLAERPPEAADPLRALLRLERYERQALTRRSRALLRLEQILAPLPAGEMKWK
jgi:hypothetical protein